MLGLSNVQFQNESDWLLRQSIFDEPDCWQLTNSNRSRDWTCPHCQQSNIELLPNPPQVTENASEITSEVDIPPPSPATVDTTSSNVDLRSETPTASATPSTTTITACTSEPSRGTTNVEYLARSNSATRDVGTSTLRRHGHKPPVLLDAAICILLVSLFAIICRRMV